MIHLLYLQACIFLMSCSSSHLMPSLAIPMFLVFCASASLLTVLSLFHFSKRNLVHAQYIWFTLIFFSQSGWKKLLLSLKSSSETSGALDLGGASTQITFVSKVSSESPENQLYFRLYGKDYQVYTHSFLCYGKDQALQKKLAMDLQASTSTPVTEQSWALPSLGFWCCESCCIPAHLLVWIREMSLFCTQIGHEVPKEVTVNTFTSTTNLRCLDSWARDSKRTAFNWSTHGR